MELIGLQESDNTSSLYSDNSENCILPKHIVVNTHKVRIYILHNLFINQLLTNLQEPIPIPLTTGVKGSILDEGPLTR